MRLEILFHRINDVLFRKNVEPTSLANSYAQIAVKALKSRKHGVCNQPAAVNLQRIKNDQRHLLLPSVNQKFWHLLKKKILI